MEHIQYLTESKLTPKQAEELGYKFFKLKNRSSTVSFSDILNPTYFYLCNEFGKPIFDANNNLQPHINPDKKQYIQVDEKLYEINLNEISKIYNKYLDTMNGLDLFSNQPALKLINSNKGFAYDSGKNTILFDVSALINPKISYEFALAHEITHSQQIGFSDLDKISNKISDLGSEQLNLRNKRKFRNLNTDAIKEEYRAENDALDSKISVLHKQYKDKILPLEKGADIGAFDLVGEKVTNEFFSHYINDRANYLFKQLNKHLSKESINITNKELESKYGEEFSKYGLQKFSRILAKNSDIIDIDPATVNQNFCININGIRDDLHDSFAIRIENIELHKNTKFKPKDTPVSAETSNSKKQKNSIFE